MSRVYRIQTLDKISAKGLELLPREGYEVGSEIPRPDAIILRSHNMHDMAIPSSVRAIGRAGAGVNNIPVDACSALGIVVFNTPGANANSVKEMVLMSLLLSSRRVADGMAWVKSLVGQGAEVPKLVEQRKSDFAGPEIKGKKLGVIGLGAIGVMVANDATALGMEVTGYDPFISVEAAWGLSRAVKRAAGLSSLIAESDYLTVHVPLNEKTQGLINRETCAQMKKGTRLLNFSRGGLVDNDAVREALASGQIASYVTDFPDEELLREPHVIAFPHLAASTPEAEENCATMAVTQVRNYLEFGTIENSVNFPQCQMAPSASRRIVVANSNVPNMVGQITTLLAEYKINIQDMINKSRGDFAYNIIDVENEVSEDLLQRIRAVDGVVMTRLIEIE